MKEIIKPLLLAALLALIIYFAGSDISAAIDVDYLNWRIFLFRLGV